MGRHARTPPPEPDVESAIRPTGEPTREPTGEHTGGHTREPTGERTRERGGRRSGGGAATSRPPAVSSADVLGWGAFATVVGAVLAGCTGHGWGWALPVLGLGAGATAILWAMTRTTPGRRRATGPSHRRRARHSSPVDQPVDASVDHSVGPDDEASATHPEHGARGA